MSRGEVLERADFDPKLRVYLVVQGALVLAATIVGILLIPLWLLAGPLWARRYFEHLECVLTERSLVYKKGILFRSETTIPLDKIQDLTVKYGPVLDWLGLAKLSVVTAGQRADHSATIGLVGVVDAPAFRDRVLARRDRLEGRSGPESAAGRASEASVAEILERMDANLSEMLDLMRRSS